MTSSTDWCTGMHCSPLYQQHECYAGELQDAASRGNLPGPLAFFNKTHEIWVGEALRSLSSLLLAVHLHKVPCALQRRAYQFPVVCHFCFTRHHRIISNASNAGRVAMLGFLGLVIVEQTVKGGSALF